MNFNTLNNGNSSTAQVRSYQPQTYNTVAQADFGRDPSTLADPMPTKNYDGAGLSKEALEDDGGLYDTINLISAFAESIGDYANQSVKDAEVAIKQAEKRERHQELERRILSGQR